MKKSTILLKKYTILILALLLAVQLIAVPSFALNEEGTGYNVEESAAAAGADTASSGVASDADSAASGTAAADAETAPDTSATLQFIEKEPDGNLRYIEYPFLDTKSKTYTWAFPYTDEFFKNPSDKFSLRMAQGSLGLALSAFRSKSDSIDLQYRTYLKKAGFKRLHAFGYDKPTERNSLSGIIGIRRMKDCTVIACVTCGQGYGNEWQGNLVIGSGERHEGFDTAAKLLESYIEEYISNNNINGKKKLWITGISRAAAVANITAADLKKSGGYEDIYAYLFGVPRTTKKPLRYSGIYNICGQYDPVAAIPFQSWGYERYGIDLYTPSQEADADYPKLAKSASKISKRLDDGAFRNNPEVNYQLRLIMEYLNEILNDSDEYASRFQPVIIRAMESTDKNDLMKVLESAIGDLVPEDAREKASLEVALDYISYIAGQHIRADQRQVKAGSWNPDDPIEANLIIEHRPSTYVKWLFSSNDAASLLTGSISSRRICITGVVNVSVYKDGEGVTAIDSEGNISVPEGGEDNAENGKGVHGVFAMRNGDQTVISLPYEESYELKIKPALKGPATVFDIIVSPERLEPEAGKMWAVGNLNRECRVTAAAESDLEVEGLDKVAFGNISEAEFSYSPTVIMSSEINSTKKSYLSLSGAYKIVLHVYIGFTVMLALCILTAMLHAHGRRRGHPPYSDLYVIIPHIICIVVLAVLTMYLAFFMFSIGKARVYCAALTVFVIYLLALRGAIRSRRPLAFAVAALLLALSGLTLICSRRLMNDSFSVSGLVTFFVIIALLTCVAVSCFRRDKTGICQNTEPPDTGAGMSIS